MKEKGVMEEIWERKGDKKKGLIPVMFAGQAEIPHGIM